MNLPGTFNLGLLVNKFGLVNSQNSKHIKLVMNKNCEYKKK